MNEDTTVTEFDGPRTSDGQLHTDLPSLVLPLGSTLEDLLGLLDQQQTVKYDRVVVADDLRMDNGYLVVRDGIEASIDDNGVNPARDLVMSPTAIFDDQLAKRINVPPAYMRHIRTTANANAATEHYGSLVSLLDANVNTWLRMEPDRKFTVRGFHNPANDDAIVRSIHSGRYGIVDHIDQLAAVLAGLQRVAEVNPEVSPDTLKWQCSLTEQHMRVKVIAPQVSILAPALLQGYRDPWLGRYGGSTGDTPPVIEAGLDIRNSETGGGAWWIIPFIHILVCKNGLTRKVDAIRRIHAGGEQIEGRITYSQDTLRTMAEAVTKQTADAVSQFLSKDWLQATVDEITETAATPVTDAKVTIEHVATKFKFTEEERESIFTLFLRGGQDTAGGVAQAITAHSHVASPTRAMALDDLALEAMATAARFASAN